MAIHIPPYKKYISDIRPASVIPPYLMVGKIQLWVSYSSIPYGMENPVMARGGLFTYYLWYGKSSCGYARKSPSGVLRLLMVRMYLRISLCPFVVL
jgi:hypothetical protein